MGGWRGGALHGNTEARNRYYAHLEEMGHFQVHTRLFTITALGETPFEEILISLHVLSLHYVLLLNHSTCSTAVCSTEVHGPFFIRMLRHFCQ